MKASFADFLLPSFTMFAMMIVGANAQETNRSMPTFCNGCTDPACNECLAGYLQIRAGAEFSFVKPRFSSNPAFSIMEADGASFESFRDTEFNYDLEVSPRVWIQAEAASGLGFRVQFWQFDESAQQVTASPPANGFGRIDHPAFGDIDITTTIPSDSFSATSSLNAYDIEFEATKTVDFDFWWMTFAAGIRYASIEQNYLAELRDSAGTQRGEIDYTHSLEGVGPTISLYAARDLNCNLSLFGRARASLVYGDGKSQLQAGEDLDLQTPFLTDRQSSRDDLLPIGELQVGINWQPTASQNCVWQPIVTAALEGQTWSGAGNASSEEGDVGFFGFHVGVSFIR